MAFPPPRPPSQTHTRPRPRPRPRHRSMVATTYTGGDTVMSPSNALLLSGPSPKATAQSFRSGWQIVGRRRRCAGALFGGVPVVGIILTEWHVTLARPMCSWWTAPWPYIRPWPGKWRSHAAAGQAFRGAGGGAAPRNRTRARHDRQTTTSQWKATTGLICMRAFQEGNGPRLLMFWGTKARKEARKLTVASHRGKSRKRVQRDLCCATYRRARASTGPLLLWAPLWL